MDQDLAFKILKSGCHVFLTGVAGSGKTYLLKRFIKDCHQRKKIVAITATTGLAATHLNGRTLHAWSGAGIERKINPSQLHKKLKKETVQQILETEILIIDEVSMLNIYLFELVDQICRIVRGYDKPFGGLQVVLSGDFFQLPPIERKTDDNPSRPTLINTPKSPFIADTHLWQQLNPTICYLSKSYRQDQAEDLIQILSALRSNNLLKEHLEKLKSRLSQTNPFNFTELYCHNLDVDLINQKKLQALTTNSYTFWAKTNATDKRALNQLINHCLAPQELVLKKDALVMFVQNDPSYQFINGTLGKVIGFQTQNGFPVVKTYDDKIINTKLATWKIQTTQGDDVAILQQIPLKLAWAITVHKSQGMTLDGAFIDLSKTFEPGMGYVALSRLKTLKNLYLKGLNPMALKMNPLAHQIDLRLQTQSRQAILQYS